MNVILRDFSFARDFRSVAWFPTLQYNMLRSAAAGVVWAVIIFIDSARHGHCNWAALSFPLLLPLGYLIVCLPLGLALLKLGAVFPIFGLVGILFAIECVSVGDPLVCILYAIAPKFVPVERPSFFSLAIIMFVLKREEAEQVVLAR
jgi:hypothetical protein